MREIRSFNRFSIRDKSNKSARFLVSRKEEDTERERVNRKCHDGEREPDVVFKRGSASSKFKVHEDGRRVGEVFYAPFKNKVYKFNFQPFKKLFYDKMNYKKSF